VGFVPPSLGVGLPAAHGNSVKTRGLQEERVELDAWKGILDALTKLKSARDRGDESAGDSEIMGGAANSS
jgi:hypothetical protein